MQSLYATMAVFLIPLIACPITEAAMVKRSKPRDKERALIAAFPQVSRIGKTLSIKTAQRIVTIEDNERDGEGAAQYTFVGTFNVGQGRTDYLVEGRYWEGYGFRLVNGITGAEISLPERPTLSPDHNRYLCASIDLEQFANPNRLIIVSSQDYTTEFKMDFKQRSGTHSGPEAAKWLSNDSISFRKRTVKAPGEVGSSTSMVLTHRDGQWTASESRQ